MKFILHFLKNPANQRQQRRSIFDSATPIKWVRDRALDHAVEKERNLKPMFNLKNLIKSEPSKSLPISIIVQNKQALEIPIRPIEFVRKYPTVFEEFLPGGIGINPHVKLTPQVLDLDSEEQLVYHTDIYKQEVADRLLKLLMVGRINKIPLQIIDKLKWDLGLPQDYAQSIVPEFPDYFCVSNCNDMLFLELVCWSSELAVSVMEKKALKGKDGYSKGMPIAFPLQYSRGFEVDKKFEKWVDDWQKLPYVSPYEKSLSSHIKSDEWDKWAVGVLHEVLNLFVPKKTEKDNILLLGEYMGVRSRFKRALLQHPGIFYVSSKLHTHTVVLRDTYKRDLLIGKHNPVMDMRSKYIHLMNMVKEENKSKSAQSGNTRKEKSKSDSKEGEEKEFEDDENEEEQDENSSHMSDLEFEDETDDDDYEDEDDDDDNEDESTMSRGRTSRQSNFKEKMRPLKTEHEQYDRRLPNNIRDNQSPTYSRGVESSERNRRDESSRRHQDRQSPTSARERGSFKRNERDESSRTYPRNERDEPRRRYPSRNEDKQSPKFSRRREHPVRNERERSARTHPSGTRDSGSRQQFRGQEPYATNKPNRSDRRYPSKYRDEQPTTYSRGKEQPESHNAHRRPQERSDVSRTRKSNHANETSAY